MSSRLSNLSVIVCAATASLFVSGCSQDGGTTAPHPDADAINGYVDGLPDYEFRVLTEAAPVDLGETFAVLVEDGWNLDYRCQAEEQERVLETNEIMSPDQNFGVLWPGAIIQGNSVESGELKPLLLDRAPLTMTINVDAPVTSIVVDVPNSVNAQQAVSDLKRSVDPNLNGDNAPSTPGTIDYISEAANSFQQSMVSMGVTAGYSAPMAPALGGSASMSLTRSYRKQTIIVRLIQRLFTIEVADDLPALREPAGFFAPSVSLEDIMAEEQDGNIGPENLPMYVKSVTYGRIIIFTLTSTTATSASNLEAAVQASYDGLSGGRQRRQGQPGGAGVLYGQGLFGGRRSHCGRSRDQQS